MIVLDAGVLIAYLDAQDDHHRSAEALLAREIDDDFASNSDVTQFLVERGPTHR